MEFGAFFYIIIYYSAPSRCALFMQKNGSREGKYSAEMKMNKTEKYVNDSFS
jgi:hypothetical protein